MGSRTQHTTAHPRPAHLAEDAVGAVDVKIEAEESALRRVQPQLDEIADKPRRDRREELQRTISNLRRSGAEIIL